MLAGVEGVELLVSAGEPVVVAAEAAAELMISPVFASEAVSFVWELVVLVEEWLRSSRAFVECGAGGGVGGVGGVGKGLSCGAAVEESAVGEFVLGSTLALFGVSEVTGDGADRVVVGCAVVLGVGELLGELVDALLRFSFGSLVVVAFGAGVNVSAVTPTVPASRCHPVRRSSAVVPVLRLRVSAAASRPSAPRSFGVGSRPVAICLNRIDRVHRLAGDAGLIGLNEFAASAFRSRAEQLRSE